MTLQTSMRTSSKLLNELPHGLGRGLSHDHDVTFCYSTQIVIYSSSKSKSERMTVLLI